MFLATGSLRPDSGAANTGSLSIAAGATAIVGGSISRTSTVTATSALVNIDGTLQTGGSNISATNINVNSGGEYICTRTAGQIVTGAMTYNNGSILTYRGTAAQATGGELSPNLYMLNIDNANGLTLNSSTTVSFRLTLTEGLIDNTVNNITLAANQHLYRYNGSIAVAPVFAGSSYIYYYGDYDITTGPELPTVTPIPSMYVSKGSSRLTINAPVTIGWLHMGGGEIYSTDTITQTGDTEVDYGSGWVNAPLKLHVATGATSKNYPLGTANGYSPVTVAFGTVGTAGYLTAAAVQSTQGNVLVPSNTFQRYWAFTPDADLAFDNYAATFSYLAADFNTGFTEATDEATMVLGKYNSGWTFPSIGTRTPGGAADGGSIQLTNLTLFSDFTAGKDQAAFVAPGDTVRPVITAWNTSDGLTTTRVSDTSFFSVSFTDTMDTASWGYTIDPPMTEAWHYWAIDNRGFTFGFVGKMQLGTVYTITADTNATDEFGNKLSPASYNPFVFTTRFDTTKPYLVATSPVDEAAGVATDAPIIYAFNEPMDTTINYLAELWINNDPGGWGVSWNARLDTVTFTHAPFTPNTSYDVELATNWLHDTSYNHMTAGLVPNRFQFTTANVGPQYEMISQPGDTYDGTGPFPVKVRVYDPGKAGVTSAFLYFQASNAAAWTQQGGTLTAPDTFDFSIPGPFANGLVVGYFIEAVDDAGDTTYSTTRQFRILTTQPPTGLAATSGVEMAVPLSWAAPAESLYYYLGGTTYVLPMPATAMASTRYTPKQYPCKIAQIRSSWNTAVGNAPIRFRIFGDDGNGYPDEATVLVDTTYTVTPGAWGDLLNLSAKNIVITSGDFHVAWEIQTTDQPRPRLNLGGVQFRSLYKWSDGNWYSDLGGDWLHRAFVQYSNAFKGGVALKSARISKQARLSVRTNPDKPKGVPDACPAPGNLPGFDMAKNVSGYEILRGPNGGPYTSIGTSATTSYTDLTAQNGNTYYYVVRTTYNTPDTFSDYSNEASATPAGKPILLVDDDRSTNGWPDVRGIYTAALDAAGQSGNYTIAETPAGSGTDGPDSIWMRGRNHVIWFCGANYGTNNTLTAADEATLAAYLNNGGRLFLCGQDYIYSRYTSGSNYTFTPGEFAYDYLGLESVIQDAVPNTTYNIAGVSLSLADGLAFAVALNPDGNYADNLTGRTGAQSLFNVTAKAGEKTAVQYSGGAFRTVFSTTLFEDITDGSAPNTKGELMARILSWLTTGVEGKPTSTASLPESFNLSVNSPNPVRGRTEVKFALPKAGRVSIGVYNVMGQLVSTLVDGTINAGYHTVTWNGRSENGQPVAAGVYLYRMQAEGFNAARKMVVIR